MTNFFVILVGKSTPPPPFCRNSIRIRFSAEGERGKEEREEEISLFPGTKIPLPSSLPFPSKEQLTKLPRVALNPSLPSPLIRLSTPQAKLYRWKRKVSSASLSGFVLRVAADVSLWQSTIYSLYSITWGFPSKYKMFFNSGKNIWGKCFVNK